MIESVFLQLQSNGQTIYFSNTIDLSGEWGMGMSVIVTDSTYHIAGIAGPGYNLCIVEVSINGEVNWIKKFGKPNEAWYPGSPGSLKKCHTGFILGGAVDTPDTTYGLFVKFDPFFDTILTKRYSNPIDDYLVIITGYQCFDSGFIFTGDISRLIGSPDILLLKTDSYGNELWKTSKDLGSYDRGWSIIQTPDSGFIIGGYTLVPGLENSGDPIVVKFDKDGTYLWKKQFGAQFKDDIAMVCLKDDSTFTVLTTYTDSMYTPDVGYSRINLIRLTEDGDVLWNRKYGSPLLGIYVSDIKKTGDGGFICCGYRYIPDIAVLAGRLFKFNCTG